MEAIHESPVAVGTVQDVNADSEEQVERKIEPIKVGLKVVEINLAHVAVARSLNNVVVD